MTDFNNNNYSMTKDMSKSVPLYHHEQVPFHSIRQSSSPAPKQQDQQNPVSGDLQDIIYNYQTQPDLLKLILLSKLEEDKRRAEEAKLRAKELDLLLIQQQNTTTTLLDDSHMYTQQQHQSMATNNNMYPQQQQQQQQQQQLPNNNTNTTMYTQPQQQQQQAFHDSRFSSIRRTSIDAILSPNHLLQQQQQQQQQPRRDSILGSSFTGSADSDDFDDRTFSPIPTSTTPVSASSLLQMESNVFKQHQLSPDYPLNEDAFMQQQQQQLENNRILATRYDFPPRPRRRREMQAITKIVETREYPYIDGYFWKNNGNTIQKKTGNKSVYYKCSNSNKGCPVNKTVTWKDNGEYLIKYRGEHLMDCNKVQRIIDV